MIKERIISGYVMTVSWIFEVIQDEDESSEQSQTICVIQNTKQYKEIMNAI